MRAILFDLFGTVIHFAPRVPTVEIAGEKWRTTMAWLHDAVAQQLPGIGFENFLKALLEVTAEVTRSRAPEYIEVSSPQRFERTLARLGYDAADRSAVARQLSLTHMAHLAAQTRLPPGHIDTLEVLSARYRLALVSNFDHGPTARAILATHGVARFFEPILISEEFGRRKPHGSIFAAALDAAGTTAAEAIFVGDSFEDDVIGAHGAGVPVVWINAGGVALPARTPQPQHTIAELPELCTLLA